MLVFRNDKDVRRFGRWILYLSPFKFKVHYTKRVNKMDHSSGMFERQEAPYKEDPLCKDLVRAVKKGIRLHQRFGRIRIFYQPKFAKTRRNVVPALLHSMLKYFHGTPMSGYLGAFLFIGQNWGMMSSIMFVNVYCVSVQSWRRIPEWGYTLRHRLVPWSGCLTLWVPRCVPKEKFRLFW